LKLDFALWSMLPNANTLSSSAGRGSAYEFSEGS
jgi:hypothetical protein